MLLDQNDSRGLDVGLDTGTGIVVSIETACEEMERIRTYLEPLMVHVERSVIRHHKYKRLPPFSKLVCTCFPLHGLRLQPARCVLKSEQTTDGRPRRIELGHELPRSGSEAHQVFFESGAQFIFEG